jgi:hypothetical protein
MKILLLIILAFPCLLAQVTVNGVPNQTLSGVGGGSPGGASGTTQYNCSGSFCGYTMAGDATINTSTGNITLQTVNGGFGGCGNSSQRICTLVTDAKGRVTSQTALNIPTPWDIRWSGAICNGSDMNATVQAALTFSNSLYFGDGCSWTLPSSSWSYSLPGGGSVTVPANTVPPNIIITGENWQTSRIKTSSPSSQFLNVGGLTSIYNMNLASAGCDSGTGVAGTDPCPNVLYNNPDVIPHPFISDGWQIITAEGAYAWDQAPIQVRQYGTGDAILAGATMYGTAFRGTTNNVANSVVNTFGTSVTWVSGADFSISGAPIWINGTRFLGSTFISNTSVTISTSAGTQSSVAASLSDGGGQIFYAQRANKGDALLIVDSPANGSLCPSTCASDGLWIEGFTQAKTSGDMIHFTQQASTYSGTAIYLDLAQATTGGTFNGNYEFYANGGVTKWQIDSTGHATGTSLTVTAMPTSCSGQPTGTLESIAGTVHVCP